MRASCGSQLRNICTGDWTSCWSKQNPAFHADDPVSELRAGQLVRVVPESERHVAELQWSVPPEQQLYREAPAAYLSHLLGCGRLRAAISC